MTEPHPWNLSLGRHPNPDEVTFDLEQALSSVVSLRSSVADDAFTAPILGTEREGQGVVISEDGLVLTIGYLVTEADIEAELASPIDVDGEVLHQSARSRDQTFE